MKTYMLHLYKVTNLKGKCNFMQYMDESHFIKPQKWLVDFTSLP